MFTQAQRTQSRFEGLEQRLCLSAVVSNGAPGILVGDFNGDTNADLLVRAKDGWNFRAGNGDGTFAAGVAVSGIPAGRLLAGDFNGDGKTDLLVKIDDETTGGLSVMLASGDGTFAAPVAVSGSPYGLPIVGDFNGDGTADLLVGGRGQANGQSLLLNNGDATFAVAVVTSGAPEGRLMAAADFTGDGKTDLLVQNRGGKYAAVTVAVGNGDGTFSAGTAVNIGKADVMVGDFTGDGKADLLTVGQGKPSFAKNNKGRNKPGPTVNLYTSIGGGTFAAPVSVSSAVFDRTVVADVTGDGKADLIIQAKGRDHGLKVELGNGDGTFAAPAAI
jgi:hypothetical protein